MSLLCHRAMNSFRGHPLGGVPGLPIRPEVAVRRVTGNVAEQRKVPIDHFDTVNYHSDYAYHGNRQVLLRW